MTQHFLLTRLCACWTSFVANPLPSPLLTQPALLLSVITWILCRIISTRVSEIAVDTQQRDFFFLCTCWTFLCLSLQKFYINSGGYWHTLVKLHDIFLQKTFCCCDGLWVFIIIIFSIPRPQATEKKLLLWSSLMFFSIAPLFGLWKRVRSPWHLYNSCMWKLQ